MLYAPLFRQPNVFTVVYVLWAFLPEPILHTIGVYYCTGSVIRLLLVLNSIFRSFEILGHRSPELCLRQFPLPHLVLYFLQSLLHQSARLTVRNRRLKFGRFVTSAFVLLSPSSFCLPSSDRFSKTLGILAKRSLHDEYSIPDIADLPVEIVNRLLYRPDSFAQTTSGLSHAAYART